ncbi:aminotransferase class IV [Flavobacteriaceae sp. LMIT009]
MLYPEKVYLNGEIIKVEEAKISVFDRGFIFGDGIYEVMVQINGRFFYGDAHLKRLKYCLKRIDIEYDVSQLNVEIPKLLEASKLTSQDCLLYIQITRGVAPRQHSFPKGIQPTVFMYVIPKVLPEINECNIEVVTQQDYRWTKCDIKMTSLLGNILANEHAINNNCYETLFIRDGKITEASHCNVFFIKNNKIYTHPANQFILNGITRQIVLELCEKLNIEVIEEGISISDIKSYDEAFLTGTSTQIASIKKIDDYYLYRDDEIGPITRKLQEAYKELKL